MKCKARLVGYGLVCERHVGHDGKHRARPTEFDVESMEWS